MAIQQVKIGAAVNDGTGDDARTCFTKINQNFTDSANAASRLVGKAPGNVIEVGAFGIGQAEGGNLRSVDLSQPSRVYNYGLRFGLVSSLQVGLNNVANYANAFVGHAWADASAARPFMLLFADNGNIYQRVGISGSEWRNDIIYTSNNTTKDSNGFIKGASPIVKLFADKIELNDAANEQDITFEKLGVGDYLVKGSLGFAQEGWYIEMPKDANGNVLVAVVYEQLDNNDISVKTYDYMLNKKGRIVPDLETPLDIPSTRWIDLRLQELPQPDVKPHATDDTVTTNA